MQVQIVKRVTLPVLKIKTGVERYFKLTSPMRTGKQVSDQMGPAEIIDATDLETGEVGVIIVPKVMQNELHTNYPNNGYVSKCFAVRFTRVPDKRYNHVSLAEIKEPAPLSDAERAAILAQRAEEAKASPRDDMGDPLDEGDEAGDEPEAPAPVAPRKPAPVAPRKPAAKKAPTRRR